MKCRFGHAHPPFAIRQTQNSVTGREGKVHCFQCRYANGPRIVEARWLHIVTPEMVQAFVAAGPRCSVCFPEETAGLE